MNRKEVKGDKSLRGTDKLKWASMQREPRVPSLCSTALQHAKEPEQNPH